MLKEINGKEDNPYMRENLHGQNMLVLKSS